MSKRSLAETLVFVSLLFISCLSVRACSGFHDHVRGCFGTVRVMFGLCSGTVRVMFGLCSGYWFWGAFSGTVKNNT